VPWSALWGQRSPLASPGASTRPYAPTGDRLAAPSAISGRIDSRARQLDSASTDELRITQIAEALVGERPPSEIVNAINEQRPFFDIAELDELLDRTKELRAIVRAPPARLRGTSAGARGGIAADRPPRFSGRPPRPALR
jgi:hypothetical protein